METSIQYQLTNVRFFDDIFFDWKRFDEDLNKGPQYMKQRLFNEWQEIKEMLKKRDDLEVNDIDKVVSEEDFDITLNRTKQGIHVFFFTFPDHEYGDASSKYVALVLAPKMPRFITLEYAHTFDGKRAYVVGEFMMDEETGKKKHCNYGFLDNDRLSFFAGYVLRILENGNE